MSELAILGGAPVRDVQTAPWPAWPEHGAEEEKALLDALGAGDWGGYPMPNTWTARFAEAFGRRHDVEHVQCVANGTVSLEIALQALGVKPGSEVIVPAYTFEATAAAALFAGCVPVLVDVEPDTGCIDPAAVEAAITARTAAIVPVHLAMSIADMDRLQEIAERHGLRILEDCAHAHGARWRGRAAGSLGDAGSFSFQTSKLLTAGEGGAVTTRDRAVYDALWSLANCGRERPGAERPFDGIGHNYRMTDLQASLLLAQLERLDDQHRRRAEQADILEAGLREIDGLRLLRRDERITTRAIYQYVFRYDEEILGAPRDVLVAALQEEGVPCDGLFYENLAESPLLRPDRARFPDWVDALESRPPECPVAARLAYHEAVWLPHQLLLGTRRDTETIVEAIRKVLPRLRELEDTDHPAIRQARTARSRR